MQEKKVQKKVQKKAKKKRRYVLSENPDKKLTGKYTIQIDESLRPALQALQRRTGLLKHRFCTRVMTAGIKAEHAALDRRDAFDKKRGSQ